MQFEYKYTIQLSKIFLFQVIQFGQTVLIQTIQFSISTVFVHKRLNVKIVLFQGIQFSIITWYSYIWSIDRTLSGVTTLGQSEPGSDGNEGMLHIPQNSSITETSPWDCLASYPGHSLEGSYPSAEVQSVYSTAPANWAKSQLEWLYLLRFHLRAKWNYLILDYT